MLTEAGSASFHVKDQNLFAFALEGAEEELPVEKDNLNSDKNFSNSFYSNYDYYRQMQNYSLAIKFYLPFISHTIFSPPPEC